MLIVLASDSPRRKELLKQMSVDFVAIKSDFDESTVKAADFKDYAVECAAGKAEKVFNHLKNENFLKKYVVDKSIDDIIVLGADTVVFANGKILNKPKTQRQARSMLRLVCSAPHSVVTGICLCSSKKTIKACEETVLSISPFTKEEEDNYIATGSPFDKAGGYGIQDKIVLDKLLSIRGSLNNVIGLPTELLQSFFKTNKILITN